MLTPAGLGHNKCGDYDAFEHLTDTLCVAPETVVAVLTAYFDEAGTDASKPAVAVGCYVATNEQWKCFNHDWRWLRDWSGVGKFFHRTDQESFWLHPKTKLWDKAKQITIYQAQHALIHAHGLKGFGGAVIKADYHAAIQGADRRALGNPYEFCLRHCMARIANYLQPDDEIIYVIESGAEGQPHLRHAFELFMADPKLRAALRLNSTDAWGFVSKEKAMPLQAADALAYEMAKQMENLLGTKKRKTRKSFLDLFRSDVDELAWWPKEGLMEACRRVHLDVAWPFDE